MDTVRRLATALFIGAIPVLLVLSNVRIAAMEPRVYGYSFSSYDVAATTGLARSQLDGAAEDIVHYFSDERPSLTTRVEVNGTEQALFTPREVLHMRDVKQLFRYVFMLHELAFAYVIAYVVTVFLWAQERSLLRLARYLLLGGLLTAALLTVGAVISFAGFDTLFTGFHLVSFTNDLWQLDPTRDRLIQMFPRDFWFTVTMAVGVATVVEGLLVATAGYGLRVWLTRPRLASARAVATAARV
jgi:integral membrane protein (TIGR01906 family)